jgi:hypothetical protein
MSDEPIYGGSIDADRLQYSIIDTARPKSKWSIGPEFDITFVHTVTYAELVSPHNAASDAWHPLEKGLT